MSDSQSADDTLAKMLAMHKRQLERRALSDSQARKLLDLRSASGTTSKTRENIRSQRNSRTGKAFWFDHR